MSFGVEHGSKLWSTQWTMWQLCDSALPIGGFAHSNGLEASLAAGAVKKNDVGSFMRFLKNALASVFSLQVPLLRSLYDNESDSQGNLLDRWLNADYLSQAVITSNVGRRASEAQGLAFLRLAFEALPSLQNMHILQEFKAQVRMSQGHLNTFNSTELTEKERIHQSVKGHFAPIFGFICLSLEIDRVTAERMFMFLTARSIVSAANRLSLIGPMQGMKLLSEASEFVDELFNGKDSHVESGNDLLKSISQVDPLLELLQASHEQLYSRLFNS